VGTDLSTLVDALQDELIREAGIGHATSVGPRFFGGAGPAAHELGELGGGTVKPQGVEEGLVVGIDGKVGEQRIVRLVAGDVCLRRFGEDEASVAQGGTAEVRSHREDRVSCDEVLLQGHDRGMKFQGDLEHS